MARQGFLGEFEQMVLLATLQLGEDAYAPGIAACLESNAGRRVSRGALYATLARLEGKGLLRWSVEAATSERGGNRRRHFQVTPAGVRALRASHRALQSLSEGLEKILARR